MRSVHVLLALVLGLPGPVFAAGPGDLGGLTERQAGAVRAAIESLDASELRDGAQPDLFERVRRQEPDLDADDLVRIQAHLESHVPTLIAVQELLQVRRNWRRLSTEVFAFSWDPSASDASGLPTRPPTPREVGRLERAARAAGERLGIEPPAALPYRIDPRVAGARTQPRADLRWGVWAADASASDAVVEALARESGGVPGLWRPLGRLLGTCDGDGACREDLLATAERSAARVGLVPVLDLLVVGHLGGFEDPAYATSLLFADLLLRECSPAQMRALLEGLGPSLGPEEVRRVLRAVLGSSPERYDRRLGRDLRTGQRGPRRR